MNEKTQRTLHLIVFVILAFSGPLGWLLIYLLYQRWNPKKKTSPKTKTNKK